MSAKITSGTWMEGWWVVGVMQPCTSWKLTFTKMLQRALQPKIWVRSGHSELKIHIFFFYAGFKLTQRIPPLIRLLHASSSLHFILHVLLCTLSSYPIFFFCAVKDSSSILLFSAPYGPSLLPFLSKYSDHDSTHIVRGGRSDYSRRQSWKCHNFCEESWKHLTSSNLNLLSSLINVTGTC